MTMIPWLTAVFLACGCYNPKLAPQSFYCHETDNPACPDGQSCFNGRCVTVVHVGTDGSASGPQDASTGAQDLSTGQNPPEDLSGSPPAPDLAKPVCVGAGGDCTYHKDSVCCSKYCIYASNTCK